MRCSCSQRTSGGTRSLS